MSDETKCAKCGLTQAQHVLDGACLAFTPPAPDPRERGVNYAAMMAARDENERDAARVVDAYLADHGVRWSPGAAQMAADLLALEALRAPAPSEAVPEDERCEVCVERRATIHLEGAVNELCAECHIERLERVVNGPVGETRRLLASFIQRVGDNCRLDADGYCQGHFLERGDECTVKRARDLLATHPAPARGVTEEQAADVLFWMASAARNGKPLAPILTAALTPDAEGGA